MVGTLQPLSKQFALVDQAGLPTDYFIRWAQERQIDIGAAISEAQAQTLIDAAVLAFAQSRHINSGTGLSGGGDLTADRTLALTNTGVTAGTYGSATKYPVITVDAQGRLSLVTEQTVSGGGGAWYFQPPSAASLSLASGDATNLTLTDDSNAGLLFDAGAPVAGPVLRTAYRTLTNKTLDWDLKVKMSCPNTSAAFSAIALYLGDSVAGKARTLEFRDNLTLDCITWTAITGGTRASVGVVTPRYNVNWWRVRHVGTNYEFMVSTNGKNWASLITVADTTHTTSRVDRVGFCVFYQRATGMQLMGEVEYFSLTGPGV